MLSLLALSTVAYADWPLGTKLEDGVLVDVTGDGLAELESLVGVFLPPFIEVPPTSLSDSSGCLFGACLYSYDITLDNLYAEVQINSLTVAPQAAPANQAILQLSANANLNINSPADPGLIDIAAELIYIDIINDACDLWVDPVNLQLDIDLTLALTADPAGIDVDGDGAPDTKLLDVTVGTATWSWDATGNDIQFGGCGLADVINSVNDVLGFFGLDLYDTILGFVEPEIDALITELPAEIEPLLEDAFAGLVISESIDLLGTPLALSLYPSSLQSDTNGMRIGLASYVDVPVHPCVEKYGITASLATPGAPPDLTHPGSPLLATHAAAMIDDDFVNHVLFAAWSGGLLCFDLADPDAGLDLPLPIDTSLLGLLAPGVFDHLFPETAPMGLKTDPRVPPILDMSGPNDLNILADPLGLEFTVELDGRKTRLMNIDLAADIGADLDYTDGLLAIEVNADAGAIVPSVSYNEFVPDASATIESSFSGLFDALVGPLIGGLLTDLTFPLPAFAVGDADLDGFPDVLGVEAIEIVQGGSGGDWAVGYASIAAWEDTTGAASGCDEKGGCDTSGCSTGCTSSGGLPARLVLLVFPLVAAGLRRRR